MKDAPDLLATAQLLDEAAQRIRDQENLLFEAAKNINEWQQLALAAQRGACDIAISFRAAQEQPELDLSKELDELICNLRDTVALMEERLPHS